MGCRNDDESLDLVNYRGEIDMGYRSEVGYVLTFPSKVKREEFVAVAKLKGGEFESAVSELEDYQFNKRINSDALMVGNFGLRFHEHSIKWYDHFEDVKAHHTLMRMCANDAFRGVYQFIRIGEEDGDIAREEGQHESFEQEFSSRLHTTHPEIVFEDW